MEINIYFVNQCTNSMHLPIESIIIINYRCETSDEKQTSLIRKDELLEFVEDNIS